jgi:hypothetical protein
VLPDTVDLSRLIETTPREEVLPLVVSRIEQGLSPAELMVAIYLAATHTNSTRETFDAPQHALLMMPSIMEASRIVAPRDPWQPLLWWVDFYKWGQADLPADMRPMAPADELRPVPAAHALTELRTAVDELDGDRAERAVIALYRAEGREHVVDELLRLGSRDLRHIGHKTIHAAGGCRFLAATEWKHAEQVFRSIALTLALPDEEAAGHDYDSSWVDNQRRLGRLPSSWPQGTDSDEAVIAMLASLRSASPGDACEAAVEWARRGASAQCIRDAVFLGSAELMFNKPANIVPLHALTASNAAGFAHDTCRRPEARGLVLLQSVARVAYFHRYAESIEEPEPGSLRIESLEPAEAGRGEEALDAIFDDIGKDATARLRAAQRTLAHVQAGEAAVRSLQARATERVVATANDSHNYKICATAFEDFGHVSERWRGRYLAACTSRFRGTSAPAAKLGVVDRG